MTVKPGSTERCLLLCVACPENSKKYGAVVCMAGLTIDGEFRRIYPIPLGVYSEKNLEKRRWIEYEVQEKGDYRKESYKIDPDSIVVGEKEKYDSVREIIDKRITTISKLNERQENNEEVSLGIIKPTDVDSFSLDESEERRKLSKSYNNGVKVMPYHARYSFTCGGSCPDGCLSSQDYHNIMCEDIEVGNSYWNWKENYENESVLEDKLEERFAKWMFEERDLYFMVGTHYQWKSWLVVSVLYPPKVDNRSLMGF